MTIELKSKTIIVVDDEPDICEALELALGLEGYRVAAVTNRDAALRLVTDADPALIFLDYRMPGLDPHQFVGELKKLESSACIILMTAGKDPSERARELGLKYYLSKPFELDAMLDLVRKCTSLEEEEH
jgi:CheY-like chemotaxis protein